VTSLLARARERFRIIGEIQHGKPGVQYIGHL
jgi:hypothetical protein